MYERILCPDRDCGAPADIIAHWTLLSTSGPVEQVRTRCEAGHVFTPTVDMLERKPVLVAASR
jgi:hypothetical protein